MIRPTVIVFSPHEHWPEPLRTLCARKMIALRPVHSCHELAAEIALQARAGAEACAGILVDAQWLSRREREMMHVIQRHAALPIWSLPAAHPRPGMELNGFLPWGEALRALAQLLQSATTRDVAEGSSATTQDLQNSGTVPDNALAKMPEIPLDTRVAARYDGLEAPLLSRSEIAALLGTSE